MDQLGDLDHEKLITAGLLLQGVFVLCYTICSFVVASTANMGFNAVLTALLYIFYVAGTYHVLQRSKMPLAIGFVLGVSVMITFLSLMTAIFWGQLSNCSPGYYDVKRYSCTVAGAVATVPVQAAGACRGMKGGHSKHLIISRLPLIYNHYKILDLIAALWDMPSSDSSPG
ncbi:Hypothetical protein NocV09_00104580 [Nannochloropsis oceanica]